MLSSLQLNAFRKFQKVHQETDIKGEKGAYFISTDLFLTKNSSKSWKIIANVNQNQAQVIQLTDAICNDKTLDNQIIQDIDLGTNNPVSYTHLDVYKRQPWK